MIEVESLRKNYGKIPGVVNVSFQARDGAITGLLGSNGAGKTTTLRMIGAVLQPDSGRVVIDGHSIRRNSVNEHQRVGALLDHAGLYGRLTVRENIAYFGRLRGMPPRTLERRIDEIVGTLGMESIVDRRACGLSQGERMKVAFGRAIIHSPRNVILDEPTNGLDVPTVRAFREVVKQMREAGVCIVFSSHILDDVRAVCDTVVLISKGHSVASGPPEDLCLKTGSRSLEDAFMKLTSQTEES